MNCPQGPRAYGPARGEFSSMPSDPPSIVCRTLGVRQTPTHDLDQRAKQRPVPSMPSTTEASMADSDRKDTFGYLGNEDMTAKEILRCVAASLEQMAKSEGAEAVELVRSKA